MKSTSQSINVISIGMQKSLSKSHQALKHFETRKTIYHKSFKFQKWHVVSLLTTFNWRNVTFHGQLHRHFSHEYSDTESCELWLDKQSSEKDNTVICSVAQASPGWWLFRTSTGFQFRIRLLTHACGPKEAFLGVCSKLGGISPIVDKGSSVKAANVNCATPQHTACQIAGIMNSVLQASEPSLWDKQWTGIFL